MLLDVHSDLFRTPHFGQDIIKNTWEDHPDYNNLVTAAKVMNETGSKVNEAIRDHDNKNKVDDISSQLIGLSVWIMFLWY